MGARPDVDAILAGYNWSIQNGIDHPEYVGHVCACAGTVAESDAATYARRITRRGGEEGVSK